MIVETTLGTFTTDKGNEVPMPGTDWYYDGEYMGYVLKISGSWVVARDTTDYEEEQ